jgi:hypothetical protein
MSMAPPDVRPMELRRAAAIPDGPQWLYEPDTTPNDVSWCVGRFRRPVTCRCPRKLF